MNVLFSAKASISVGPFVLKNIHLSVCAVSTLQQAFSYEGCYGESCEQYSARLQALKTFPTYKYVGVPSHSLRLQTLLPRLRLSLGD